MVCNVRIAQDGAANSISSEFERQPCNGGSKEDNTGDQREVGAKIGD